MAETPDGQSGESGAPEEAGFSQDDIDALMQGDGTSGEAAKAASGSEAVPPADPSSVGQDDIDAQLNASDASGAVESAEEAAPQASDTSQAESQPDTAGDALGGPFDEAAAATAAEQASAQSGSVSSSGSASSAPALNTKAFELTDLGAAQSGDIDGKRITMLNDVALRVKLELGQTRMLVEDVLKMGEGSVVELDKLAGDPVDVIINDRLIARGEVLVLNDVFCVRVSEVVSHDPHRVTT